MLNSGPTANEEKPMADYDYSQDSNHAPNQDGPKCETNATIITDFDHI